MFKVSSPEELKVEGWTYPGNLEVKSYCIPRLGN